MATLRTITVIRRRYFTRVFLFHNASHGLDEICVLHHRREYQTFAFAAIDPDADGLLVDPATEGTRFDLNNSHPLDQR
jgi:hypothetical protein